ncbi:Disease resistance protein RGA2 [Rhynchospora pubera]|uniref:Disease resistance protein RGA2 n=1 Tax=Rhynchospora pubera TaxID=906938 RepID=A0AAV8EN51_9POAL|nr:Disease resistance protein RGA2 [Rhynchospora pubera]
MANWVASIVGELGSWVGTAAVQKFVDMGIESYLSKRKQSVDSEAALKRVQKALPQIRAVMGVAEALKMKDPSTRKWVQQFRDAVDAAEDVLDELEYKKLKSMVQNRGNQEGGSSSSSKKRKTYAMPIGGDILERLEKAVAMLDEATVDVEKLCQCAEKLGIRSLSESQLLEVRTDLNRETTSFLAEREVFGRDDEKAQIISWLTRETEDPLSSFGIVGVGGLGKTTLAQSVYQELSKASYFEKTIWVCVSTQFSVKVITANILAELGEECKGDNPLNVLQQRLRKIIHSKKIFLILDDVWEDKKMKDWEQLIAPLRFAQQGSKMLFTTRQKSVAEVLASVISTTHESLRLRDLEEQQLRLIFNSYAFHLSNPDAYGDLQAIGDQIIKKLHGNPLAARVIGSLLMNSRDPNYWRNILNHDSLINLEHGNEVMEVLKLSYYNLPADLQVCFRFCSIFPEDHEFDKDDLIKMWMASGFLQQKSREQKRPEDIGEDYFNILLRKSFFEVSKIEEGYYVMHDLIHELATNVSEGECCRVGPGHNDKSLYIPSTILHVSVHESKIQEVSHLENICSLVITTCNQQDETDLKFFVLPDNLVKKGLRLLKIEANRCCKLQDELSYSVHLRYLSIGPRYPYYQLFQHIIHAPIYKFYHLLILEVKGYSKIETTGMANLVRLRYMQLPDQIMKTISGVHMMTSLQQLTFFVGRESGHHVNELSTLNNLRLLTICNVENIRDPVEATSANLLAKKNLRSLKLICTSDETNLDNPEEIFDNLQPHQNLMELEIRYYNSQRFPMWTMGDMPHLSTFKLDRCPYLNNQSSFGQMPHLKILAISDCPNINILPDMPFSLTDFTVRNVGLTALPRFSTVHSSTQLSQTSSLRYVNIEKCPNLIMLDGFLQQGTVDLHYLERLYIKSCENLAQIPTHAFRTCVSLKHLEIEHCPKLTSLRDMPLSLTNFTICDAGLTALPRFSVHSSTQLSQASSLRCVDIIKCPNLIMSDGFLQLCTIDLHGLKELRFDSCENLAQIPMDAFSICVSLELLVIRACPKLTSLPCLPLSLITFEIDAIGVSALPEYLESSTSGSSDSPPPPSSFITSSLRFVYIRNCPNLIELDGFFQQDNIEFRTINLCCVYNCENLVQIPKGAFKKFVSLNNLWITKCPKLAAVGDNWNNLLPSKLTELYIENCGELDVPLLESSSHLTTLTDLTICDSANITHIPSTENVFGSLSSLNISECPKLIEFSSMQQAHSVDQGSNVASLKIKRLEIDQLSLLSIDPLRSLRSVSALSVFQCSSIDAWSEQWLLQNSSTLGELNIWNASTLRSLPATMARFTALEYLRIWHADSLVELPDLPAPLNVLEIKSSDGADKF